MEIVESGQGYGRAMAGQANRVAWPYQPNGAQVLRLSVGAKG